MANEEAVIKQLQEMVLYRGKEEWLESQDKAFMKKRFEVLFEHQEAVDVHLKKLAEERRALEAKYSELCAPHIAARDKVVTGEDVPEGGEGDLKGIPDFWSRVFTAHEAFEDLVSEKDVAILEHLQHIVVDRYSPAEEEDTKAECAVKLTFTFSPNDFFDGTELSKIYYFVDLDEEHMEKAVGSDIKWKEGKDPTKKVLKKKDKSGGFRRKSVEQTSLFSFFSPPKMPSELAELTEEQAEQLEEAVELDFALGSAIADEIVPCALKYYTGEATMHQSFRFGMDDDDEDDDDDDDDDDDEDDDDDDDDDDDGPGKAPMPGKGGEGQQECKQQ